MVRSLLARVRFESWARAGAALAIAVSTLLGCRFGGASSSLSDPVAPLDELRVDGGTRGESGHDSKPQVEAGPKGGVDAGSVSSSSPGSDAGTTRPLPTDSGSTGDVDAASPAARDAAVDGEPDAQPPNPSDDDAGSCGRTIPVCDPIRKTGCPTELQMQCDVDLLATTPTGICVFSAPSPDPNACLNIPPTESCPAGQTCVDAKCHTICLCDSECESGSCCNKAVSAGGFKLCSPC